MITINFYTTLRLYVKLKELHIKLPQSVMPILDVLNMIESEVVERTSKPILLRKKDFEILVLGDHFRIDAY